MATTQSQQSFVAPNFDSGDVKSQAGATSNVASSPQDLITQQVVSAANAHGIVVSSQNVQQSPHQTTLPVNTVTLTVQPTQLQASQVTIQPQIITANVISSEDFQAKEGTAILKCYSCDPRNKKSNLCSVDSAFKFVILLPNIEKNFVSNLVASLKCIE